MTWEEEEVEPDLYQINLEVSGTWTLFSCQLTHEGRRSVTLDVKESPFHPLMCVKPAFIPRNL